MSASMYLHGELFPLAIECDEDGAIWLRDRKRSEVVALTLTPAQLDTLEAAIAKARDTLAAQQVAA